MTTPDIARHLWSRYERIHAATYFAAEAADAAAEAGYRGFWMGYFAQRAAPLGAVGPAVVTSCFFGFHRSRVERALPDAWTVAGPERALQARLAGVDRTLRRLWGGDLIGSGVVAEAADLLWSAAGAADPAGRVLGAANQALPRPELPHLALWQATATLREHRGDGHVAALVGAGVGPLEAALIKIAADEADGAGLRRGRAWPTEDWAAGEAALVDRGWLVPPDGPGGGALTAAGRDAHADIERRTDDAAASPWAAIGPQRTERAAGLLDLLLAPIVTAEVVPAVNPIGVPLPDLINANGPRGPRTGTARAGDRRIRRRAPWP